MRRGLTLLELLISLVITVVVAVASTRAYEVAITFDQRLRQGRDVLAERQKFEDRITFLLHHAWLSTSTTNPNSYFIGEAPTVTASASGLQSGLQSTLNTSQTPGGASTSSSTGGSAGSGTGSYGTPNVMVFTAAGLAPSSAYLASNNDSESNNQTFGPQGGIHEIEISQSAVGAQGQSLQGVFLREQIPADNDPTQGGNEYLLSSQLTQIGFEFFDGTQWQSSWDSRSQTPAPGQMPAAVRVTYKFKGDTYDHVFIVQISASSVNYLNPVTVTG